MTKLTLKHILMAIIAGAFLAGGIYIVADTLFAMNEAYMKLEQVKK